jgi:hypothetical protein
MKVTWAVEWDPSAAATFMRSHPDAVVMNSDVELILHGLEKKDRALPKRGEIDVIIGGPPCQGFSQANRNRTVEGSNPSVVVVVFWCSFCLSFSPNLYFSQMIETNSLGPSLGSLLILSPSTY